MKLSKRILSAFLAIVMVLSTAIAVGASNVTFTDVSGHWAWTGGQIQYLVDKGVLNGYKQPNGTYKFVPNGEVTRAEFIKMLDETFGLTATTSISFSDVKTTDWFYPYFAKAAAQGYLLNYGNSVSPNGKITREEAISLLVRYLDLPANEKSDPSYFADYNSISENYRDNVLRGVYAGLIDGYNEGGVKVFKPKGTLTRAEALTILYRAAGCIYTGNAYSRDDGAADTNNVITKGNVILNGINLTGRVIVTEGVTSGTVNLTGCSVNDTLYIRGTANVTLDDCRIEHLVITNGCQLSVQNGTRIGSLTVCETSSLNIYTGTTVETLVVENGAERTSVSGNGTVEMAYINASGFTSLMVPVQFQIGNNLTATFASNQYQGSSDSQDAFSMTPFVTSDEANYYLNIFPAADGTVYYYFTNGSNPPTTVSFDSYCDASSFSGNISVEAGEVISEKTFAASAVRDFEYVVLQLQDGSRKYAPVMIPNTNTDGNGFSTTPYLASETTVKYVAAEGGTLYWFYSDSGKTLTQTEFLREYSETDSALRKEENAISGRTSSFEVKEKYLANYDYLVVMLKGGSGSYYTPIIVPVGENGFAEEPELKTVGTITFKTEISGELYYYYSENADLPSADGFKGAYNKAEYGKQINVSKNVADSFEYNPDYSDEFPYLIIALRGSDKEYLNPVAVCIDYQSGFASAPEIVDETTIRFKTEDDGDVLYYYTKTETAPTSAEFHDRYDSVANRYKDSVSVNDSYERIEYKQEYAKTYPYMAFMFIDEDGKEYTPVVLALDASASTGFVIAPYILDGRVYFKTEGPGEVWYFYQKTDQTVASSEFEDEYDDAKYFNSKYVSGGVLESFELDEDAEDDNYDYLVIAFLSDDKEDDKKFGFPVILDVEDGGIKGSGLSIGSIRSDAVSLTAYLEGRVYYYFSDSSSVTADNFMKKYNNAKENGHEGCEEGEELIIRYEEDVEYDYLIICLQTETSSGTEIFLSPEIINLENRTSESIDDGSDATTDKTGLTYSVDSDDRVVTIISQYDGEVTVSLKAGSMNESVISTISVEKGEAVPFEYGGYLSILDKLPVQGGGNGATLILQLSADGETFRRVSIAID